MGGGGGGGGGGEEGFFSVHVLLVCAAEQIWYGHVPRLIPSIAVR